MSRFSQDSAFYIFRERHLTAHHLPIVARGELLKWRRDGAAIKSAAIANRIYTRADTTPHDRGYFAIPLAPLFFVVVPIFPLLKATLSHLPCYIRAIYILIYYILVRASCVYSHFARERKLIPFEEESILYRGEEEQSRKTSSATRLLRARPEGCEAAEMPFALAALRASWNIKFTYNIYFCLLPRLFVFFVFFFF